MYPYSRPSRPLDLGGTWVNLLVAALAASFALLGRRLLNPGIIHDPYAIGVLAGALLGFVLHEYAHERVALKGGCWARFMLHPFGLALTLVSGLIPFIAIIAPGAVSIACPSWGWGSSSRLEERIAAAGVTVNIAIAFAAIALHYIAPSAYAKFAAVGAAEINAWIAIFNLLPVPPLDGWRLARLNPGKWLTLLAASIIAWLLIP